MKGSKRKTKIIILMSVLVFVIVLGVVYFASGYAETSSNNDIWNISITDIQSTNIRGHAINVSEPTYNDLTANFNTNLASPGDSITYKITIQNKGKVDATLKKITMVDSTNPLITFSNSGVAEGNLLPKGETHQIDVTVAYNDQNSTLDESTTNTTITLDYEQSNPEDIVDVVITVIWEDDDITNRPDNIVIHLKGTEDEHVTESSKWVKNGNTWTYTFEDILNEEYTLYEEEIANYVSPFMGEENASKISGTDVSVTNTLKKEEKDIITITSTWDSDEKPDNIKVHLIDEEGNEYITDNSKWVKNGSTWTYTFELPKGKYKIYEEEIKNYSSNIMGKNQIATITDNNFKINHKYNKPVVPTPVEINIGGTTIRVPNTLKDAIPWALVLSIVVILIGIILLLKKDKEEEDEKAKQK